MGRQAKRMKSRVKKRKERKDRERRLNGGRWFIWRFASGQDEDPRRAASGKNSTKSRRRTAGVAANVLIGRTISIEI